MEIPWNHHCSWGMTVCGFRGLPIPTNLCPHKHITKLLIIIHCNATQEIMSQLTSKISIIQETLAPTNKKDSTVNNNQDKICDIQLEVLNVYS